MRLKKGKKREKKKPLTRQKLLKTWQTTEFWLDAMNLYESIFFHNHIDLGNGPREVEEHRNQKIVVVFNYIFFSLLLFPHFIFAILWQ